MLIKKIAKKILSFLPDRCHHWIHAKHKYYSSLLSVYVLRLKITMRYGVGVNVKRLNAETGLSNIEDKKHANKRELTFDDITKFQKMIDALSYPPTHEYDLQGLKPRGTLKLRLSLLETIAPDFFKGTNFLDVGCNKGFFSLLASQYFDQVQSIDVDQKFTSLCNLIKQPNMNVSCTSFRDFVPQQESDKILIGNVHHYLFREAGGWEWIYKLAAISCGYVLIEGPIDMNCQDMIPVIPQHLQEQFTFEKFMEIMGKFFTLESKIASMSPDRYVMLFKRKPDEFDQKLQLDQLPISKILKEDKNSIVYLTVRNNLPVVAKIYKNPDSDLRIRINIARLSPISNGALGSIYSKGQFIGWIEEYRDDEIHHYKENQVELFKLVCVHNMYLAKLGYFDGDCATINFFKRDCKLFDKGLVTPIKKIDESVYQHFPGYDKGYYFIHLEQSYDIINKDVQDRIRKAFESKDSYIIETTFDWIKNNLC